MVVWVCQFSPLMWIDGCRLAVWGAEQEAREQLMAQGMDEPRIQVMTRLEQEKIHKIKEAEVSAVMPPPPPNQSRFGHTSAHDAQYAQPPVELRL